MVSYWRVNLHIENDSSYQDWLNSPVKFINDNLQIINDFANDFEGGFLTKLQSSEYSFYQ